MILNWIKKKNAKRVSYHLDLCSLIDVWIKLYSIKASFWSEAVLFPFFCRWRIVVCNIYLFIFYMEKNTYRPKLRKKFVFIYFWGIFIIAKSKKYCFFSKIAVSSKPIEIKSAWFIHIVKCCKMCFILIVLPQHKTPVSSRSRQLTCICTPDFCITTLKLELCLYYILIFSILNIFIYIFLLLKSFLLYLVFDHLCGFYFLRYKPKKSDKFDKKNTICFPFWYNKYPK
ncbi:hypothetical protein AB205_0162680 [Aquarana catesbeiana]|uniref:Uncharacterized protein n=1 Tax=Aquarana catesbeiana TaxID=8400 RepID=A0A2G9RRK4_AQUCT|nr:hypothetical protein AB205_0162680 [Aquarana catesbeiana]